MDEPKKCNNCWGYGICKLHKAILIYEGHIPTLIEENFAEICPNYYKEGELKYD